jgi:hypothetical protein
VHFYFPYFHLPFHPHPHSRSHFPFPSSLSFSSSPARVFLPKNKINSSHSYLFGNSINIDCKIYINLCVWVRANNAVVFVSVARRHYLGHEKKTHRTLTQRYAWTSYVNKCYCRTKPLIKERRKMNKYILD